MAEKEEDELRKLQEKLARQRARNTAKKAQYQAKYPERMAAARKRYKERHPDRVQESKQRYDTAHGEERNAHKRRRYHESEEMRENHRRYMQRYRVENRERYLARRRELYRRNKEKRQAEKREAEKREAEKRQALTGKRLRVVLTDFVKDFCLSLEKEGDCSPSSTPVEPEGDCLTVTDLDSEEIQPLDQPAWDKEANQWLDEVLELLEDPLKETGLDDRKELYDLLKDMSPEH